MSKNFISATADSRLRALAETDSLRTFIARLKYTLAMELAKPEPDEDHCSSLQRTILELTLFIPSLNEEDA